MATCKDCIKNDVCELYCHLHSEEDVEKRCKHIANKADFVEVKHGEWLHNDTECSVCKTLNPTLYLNEWELEYKATPLPHCPYCCAKMDGGDTDGKK